MTPSLRVDLHPRRPSCSACGAKAQYWEVYDLYACAYCDAWLDPCRCKPEDGCPFPKPKGKPSGEGT